MKVKKEEARLGGQLKAAVDAQAVQLLLHSSCLLVQMLLIGMLSL